MPLSINDVGHPSLAIIHRKREIDLPSFSTFGEPSGNITE
jgi:hypothetical protein